MKTVKVGEPDIVAYCEKCGRKFISISGSLMNDCYGFREGKIGPYEICGGRIVRVEIREMKRKRKGKPQ